MQRVLTSDLARLSLPSKHSRTKTEPVDNDWIDDFDLNNPNTAATARDLKQLDSDLYGFLSEALTGTAHTPVMQEKTSSSGLALLFGRGLSLDMDLRLPLRSET
jgi:hypothetical protein